MFLRNFERRSPNNDATSCATVNSHVVWWQRRRQGLRVDYGEVHSGKDMEKSSSCSVAMACSIVLTSRSNKEDSRDGPPSASCQANEKKRKPCLLQHDTARCMMLAAKHDACEREKRNHVCCSMMLARRASKPLITYFFKSSVNR
jgi:hypothetical protein